MCGWGNAYALILGWQAQNVSRKEQDSSVFSWISNLSHILTMNRGFSHSIELATMHQHLMYGHAI